MGLGIFNPVNVFRSPKKALDPLGIFSRPDPPPVTTAPPVPQRGPASPAVKQAGVNAQRRELRRKGRKSTILTSGRGVADDSLPVSRPQLGSGDTSLSKLLGGQ